MVLFETLQVGPPGDTEVQVSFSVATGEVPTDTEIRDATKLVRLANLLEAPERRFWVEYINKIVKKGMGDG